MRAIDNEWDRSSFQAGLAIAERYRLIERLGTGGMGAVWRATHVTLAHDVAIKFLQVRDSSSDARARFEREAKLAARLGEASRHITRVIDYGMLGTTPYLVMELLQGETLSQRLRRERRLPLELAAKMIAQLCRALQVAHGAGVIHRDLKPSNIFLARSDFHDEVIVKLMDFGVAKSTEVTEDEETTGAGTIIGTPGYMSPEQILCKRLDARTDLWGVGATVYRLLCGRSPFGQGSIAELGLRIVATDPIPPTTLNSALPTAIDTWMEKALAKSAEDRFQSARDLADALALIAGTRNHHEPVGEIMPLPEETLPPARISVLRDDPPTRIESRRPVRALATAPLLWIIAALAGGVAIERTRTRAEVVALPSVAPSPSFSAFAIVPSSSTPAVVVEGASASAPVASSAPPKPKTAPGAKTKSTIPPALAHEGKRLWEKRDEL
jgi:serine/threonine-protein kinase